MLQQAPTAVEVRRALGAVYARPEFAERELPGFVQWMAELYDGAVTAVRELMLRLFTLDQTGPVLRWILIVWLCVTAVAILVHAAWTTGALWRGRDRSGARREAGADAAGESLSATTWERRAREAAAAGRLREASAALYQALLLHFDERGAVRYDPAKTPGDYRRELRDDAGRRRVLDRFLGVFEPIAFGGRAPDADGYGLLRSAVAESRSRA